MTNHWRRILQRGSTLLFALILLAQLANIPARMTLYELLCLSKEIRETLRNVLADSKTFLTQVPAILIDDDGTPYPQCHLVKRQVPSITFTSEDMLLKDNKHDRPLYYTWYIGSTCIERIQVDQRFALSTSRRGSSTSWASHSAGYPP